MSNKTNGILQVYEFKWANMQSGCIDVTQAHVIHKDGEYGVTAIHVIGYDTYSNLIAEDPAPEFLGTYATRDEAQQKAFDHIFTFAKAEKTMLSDWEELQARGKAGGDS